MDLIFRNFCQHLLRVEMSVILNFSISGTCTLDVRSTPNQADSGVTCSTSCDALPLLRRPWIYMLCQQISPKRWFGNVNTTSYCDVTNIVYPVTMTTKRHCSILEFGRGHPIKQSPRASPDLCTTLSVWIALNLCYVKMVHIIRSFVPLSESLFVCVFIQYKHHAFDEPVLVSTSRTSFEAQLLQIMWKRLSANNANVLSFLLSCLGSARPCQKVPSSSL